MIDKLPRWVEMGGFFLTLIAGFINVIGLLDFQHQAVSHLTGVSSYIGYEMVQGNWPLVIHLNLIVLAFVLGAAAGGMIVRDGQLMLGKRYGVALWIESALLFGAMVTLLQGSTLGHLLAAAACGLQNAMTTTYSGALIRTTHVSGLFTDLGIMLGNYLRGLPVHMRKVRLYLILTNGFIVGGLLGTWCFFKLGLVSLAIPALIAAALALAYGVLLRRDRDSHRMMEGV